MNRMYRVALGLASALAVLGSASALAADDYKGAEALLTQIGSAKTSGTAVLSPQRWLGEMDAFRSNSAALPPEKAASQWLDLAVSYSAFKRADITSLSGTDRARMRINSYGEGLRDPLLRVLPGPAAWPALARIIDARPAQSEPRKAEFETALGLLAHTLIADSAGQHKALLALANIQDPNSTMLGSRGPDIGSLEDALTGQVDDPTSVAAAFKEKIELQKKLDEDDSRFETRQFKVPDLVTIMGGEKEATPLLTAAVLLPDELAIEGTETKRLATRLALEQIANLKSSHWELTESMDGAALYEALKQRVSSSKDSNKSSRADGYYFLHLIVAGQTDKAVAMAESIRDDSFWCDFPLAELDNAGYTQQVHDFLRSLLEKHPELPFWNEYIQLAAKAGQTGPMLELIRSMAKRTDLSDAQRINAHASFYLALLAANQIDEGVAELRKIIAAGGQGENSPIRKSVALARLGQLLDRNDLLNEGIAGAEQHLVADPPANLNSDASAITSLAELLREAGRGPEAEKILAQALDRVSGISQPWSEREFLPALMRVYWYAGRPVDVLAVLDKFPGWGVPDLKDILSLDTQGFTVAEYSIHAASDDLPVGYMGAWALAQCGRQAQALKIVKALLDRMGNFDPGYELLIKLSGSDAISQLDRLARQDRFETRPLIWKAQLQLDAGKLDDAEKSARAAVAIDPTDGHQGPGRRLREYSVLADILDRKGDKEHAQVYRGAVTAVRMSEHGDRYYEAGLLKQAVKTYEDALTHFADAYCIQARIALRLAEMGDSAGAEEHYQRAYELMPQSFGRVESHCFGCEQDFKGARAQGIAEKVFARLSAKMPANPQVHYLLGYLRKAQERYREALPEFEQAVKLDPDYFNAWKEIGNLSENMHLPPKLSNEVALNQARLDPLQKHGALLAADATDLAGLWNAVSAAKHLVPDAPEPLLSLTASAAQLDNTKRNVPGFEPSAYYYDPYSRRDMDPAASIAGNRFIAAVSRIFSEMPSWAR